MLIYNLRQNDFVENLLESDFSFSLSKPERIRGNLAKGLITFIVNSIDTDVYGCLKLINALSQITSCLWRDLKNMNVGLDLLGPKKRMFLLIWKKLSWTDLKRQIMSCLIGKISSPRNAWYFQTQNAWLCLQIFWTWLCELVAEAFH